MMRPGGAGATAGAASHAAGLEGGDPDGADEATHALAGLVWLLGPTTPLPASHDSADRNVAPQTAGNRRWVRMRCGALPGSELGDGRDGAQPGYHFGRGASVEGRGSPGDRLRGAGGLRSPPYLTGGHKPFSAIRKKIPELFAVRKILNHRVPMPLASVRLSGTR